MSSTNVFSFSGTHQRPVGVLMKSIDYDGAAGNETVSGEFLTDVDVRRTVLLSETPPSENAEAPMNTSANPLKVLAYGLAACLALSVLPLSSACAGVQLETVMVPMRDGVQLATDVYRDTTTTVAPVVLMRTPYNKDRAKSAAEQFAAAGYIAVVQDCRGKFASEGVFIPYNNEGQDGFDAIEWIGRQPWCNGRIGMWGSSYVGATQWQAAVEHPPKLVTIAPTATWSSFYRNLYLGGAVRHSLIAKWASGNSPKPDSAAVTADWDQTLRHLPLSEIDDQVGWPIPWLEAMLTHPSPDGYWKRLDLTHDMLDLKMPILHVVGFYDFFSRESVNNFSRMQQLAKDEPTRGRQRLILGPWDHGTIGKSQVGELDFGPEAEWDATTATRYWFDQTLRTESGSEKIAVAAVRYFMMGQNRWHEADTWPPKEADLAGFYLHSGGRANTRQGDGRLTLMAPATNEPADHFKANPADPVPACPVTEQRPLHMATWAPVDQQSIEDRSDVLCYTSEVLTEPLSFAGNASAELYVAADTVDADWVVRLIDVHPNGAAFNLAVGILRGRFRESELQPTLLEPNTPCRITVDLGPVAAQIKPGHRLRIDISGAYFPLFDRNSNTGEGPFGKQTAIATESIYHSEKLPSRVLLPVMKARN